MKLSQKKRDALYSAIHESVVEVRIILQRRGMSDANDAVIAQVETTIWRRALAVLGVQDES